MRPITLIAIGIVGLLLFVIGYSEQGASTQFQEQQGPLIFVLNADGTDAFPKAPMSFETSTGSDDATWLLDSAERRSDLNRFRYVDAQTDEDDLREDTKKSRNWETTLDGKTLAGYDVVRDINGEFEHWQKPKKSDKTYAYTVRYGYG